MPSQPKAASQLSGSPHRDPPTSPPRPSTGAGGGSAVSQPGAGLLSRGPEHPRPTCQPAWRSGRRAGPADRPPRPVRQDPEGGAVVRLPGSQVPAGSGRRPAPWRSRGAAVRGAPSSARRGWVHTRPQEAPPARVPHGQALKARQGRDPSRGARCRRHATAGDQRGDQPPVPGPDARGEPTPHCPVRAPRPAPPHQLIREGRIEALQAGDVVPMLCRPTNLLGRWHTRVNVHGQRLLAATRRRRPCGSSGAPTSRPAPPTPSSPPLTAPSAAQRLGQLLQRPAPVAAPPEHAQFCSRLVACASYRTAGRPLRAGLQGQDRTAVPCPARSSAPANVPPGQGGHPGVPRTTARRRRAPPTGRPAGPAAALKAWLQRFQHVRRARTERFIQAGPGSVRYRSAWTPCAAASSGSRRETGARRCANAAKPSSRSWTPWRTRCHDEPRPPNHAARRAGRAHAGSARNGPQRATRQVSPDGYVGLNARPPIPAGGPIASSPTHRTTGSVASRPLPAAVDAVRSAAPGTADLARAAGRGDRSRLFWMSAYGATSSTSTLRSGATFPAPRERTPCSGARRSDDASNRSMATLPCTSRVPGM